MKLTIFLGYSVQILIFAIFYKTLLIYTTYRKGIEFSNFLINGVKYYRDEHGVFILFILDSSY